jgi:tRNA threonylcarbamoyladenosine biosynthesis protein TsaB
VIVLGIETSGPRAGVALIVGDRTRERLFDAHRALGAELAPTIQAILDDEGLGPDSPPDLVAVDIGPGSYTGLRVGLAAAKGLAFAWGRPLVGVRAIDALAVQAPSAASRVLCAIDAQRGEVYHASYERKDGRPSQIGAPSLDEPGALARALAATGDLVVIGDAAQQVAAALAGTRRIETAPEDLAWPTPRLIAELGRERHLAGIRDDALGLAPVYYRASEAEERRRKRARAGDC